MAWRIDEQVVQGEIDNRVRGRTTGRIWVIGRDEPVELTLTGNCLRDLAGRRLEFINPKPKACDLDAFVPTQKGAAGDITASRRVKVPEIPQGRTDRYYARKKSWPWHWGNSLYLEWFSERNGHVVIESASFELKIVGEAAWDMSTAEEETERQVNADAMERMAAEINEAGDDDPENFSPSSDGEVPVLDEDTAEQMEAESERLTDRIEARMAQEGADYEIILMEEMERIRQERDQPGLSPVETICRDAWLAITNRIRLGQLGAASSDVVKPEIFHPLAARAHELKIQLAEGLKVVGWQPADAPQGHPAADLVSAVERAASKIAEALKGHKWPPEIWYCAQILVRLKRAQVCLDDALRAGESCQEQNLIDSTWLGLSLVDVIDLARDIDKIIAELRERLS